MYGRCLINFTVLFCCNPYTSHEYEAPIILKWISILRWLSCQRHLEPYCESFWKKIFFSSDVEKPLIFILQPLFNPGIIQWIHDDSHWSLCWCVDFQSDKWKNPKIYVKNLHSKNMNIFFFYCLLYCLGWLSLDIIYWILFIEKSGKCVRVCKDYCARVCLLQMPHHSFII